MFIDSCVVMGFSYHLSVTFALFRCC